MSAVALYGELIFARVQQGVLRSRDRGTSFEWVFKGLNSIVNLWGSSPEQLFAVGYDTIRVTHDQGDHWSKRNHDIAAHLRAMDGLGPLHVAVAYGELTVSSDGGEQWTTIDEGVSGAILNDVVVASPDEVVVVGVRWRGGAVWCSIDGGQSFVKEETTIPEHLNRVQCFGSTLYAVGQSGAVYRRPARGAVPQKRRKACSKAVVLLPWDVRAPSAPEPDTSAQIIHKELRDKGDHPTRIFLTTDGVTRLDALADYPSLTQVSLWGRIPKDLNPLCRLPALADVSFYGSVRSLSALAGMASLERLTLKNKAPDLSPLQDCPALHHLDLSEATKVDLTQVAALTQLKTLVLPKEKVNLRLLSGTTLEGLTVHKGWASLEGLTSDELPIRSLQLQGAKVDQLEMLVGLTALEEVYVGGQRCAITDLGPLAGLTLLRQLTIQNAPILDLTPLEQLPNLRHVSLSQTHLEQIGTRDPDAWPSLESLELSGSTSLETIDGLRHATQLSSLHLNKTRVQDLAPLTALDQLQSLYLTDTPLSDPTPLWRMTALNTLALTRTRIASLAGIAALTGLEHLYIDKTRLTDLAPLSGVTRLRTLNMAGLGTVTGVAAVGALTGLTMLDVTDTSIDPQLLLPLTALRHLTGCALPRSPLDLSQPNPEPPTTDVVGPGWAFDGRLGTHILTERPYDLDLSNDGLRLAYTTEARGSGVVAV
ncbi:MAG: leucine-rich repeat domain-containing protein, partial [Myxococcota bacterium]